MQSLVNQTSIGNKTSPPNSRKYLRVEQVYMRLENKVAIVTGAARGIGRATAKRFSEEGAFVVIDDVDVENGIQLASEIIETGGKSLFIAADVSRSCDTIRLVNQTLDHFGRIDILVNNALCSTENILENNWDPIVKVALRGTDNCTQSVIPAMCENGGGSIINIASVNALIGLQNIHAYSAVKGAVVAYTRSMAVSYGVDNIRINCICPGTVETEVWLPMIEKNPNIFDDLLPFYPLGRIGQPIDIANAALFLASDESSFVTGSVLVIDGGLTAGLPQFPI